MSNFLHLIGAFDQKPKYHHHDILDRNQYFRTTVHMFLHVQTVFDILESLIKATF